MRIGWLGLLIVGVASCAKGGASIEDDGSSGPSGPGPSSATGNGGGTPAASSGVGASGGAAQQGGGPNGGNDPTGGAGGDGGLGVGGTIAGTGGSGGGGGGPILGEVCESAFIVGEGYYGLDTTGFANDYSSYTCAQLTMNPGGAGIDAVIGIDVPANQILSASLTTAAYDAVLATNLSCTNFASTCVAGSDTDATGDSETIVFNASANAYRMYFAADALNAGGQGAGAFGLSVYNTAGDACGSAIPINRANAQGAGDFHFGGYYGMANTYDPNCVLTAPGPDTVYSFQMLTGEFMTVWVDPFDTDDDPILWFATACGNPNTSCELAVDDGFGGESEGVQIENTSGGPLNLWIGVDAWNASAFGGYRVEVTIP
jgi:hypothetical protein